RLRGAGFAGQHQTGRADHRSHAKTSRFRIAAPAKRPGAHRKHYIPLLPALQGRKPFGSADSFRISPKAQKIPFPSCKFLQSEL
ncbi:MAG: hypothetical protein IKX84_07175, partial [Clostridia bacterium]|nr:hypothetical protein [Clostridia bacterium]